MNKYFINILLNFRNWNLLLFLNYSLSIMEADSKPMFSLEVSSKRRHVDDNQQIGDYLDEDKKKRRMLAGHDIGPKLVNMIKKLDEDLNGESIENALEILANTLEENLDPYEGQIIHILYECAAYLPEKITTFSTLVGILNARSSKFGEKLLVKFINELQGTFVNEEYDISIRIITFLCDLGNSHVVNVDSIFDFLEDFVEFAVEDDIKSDFFIYSVLHALPWIGPELNDKMAPRLNAMLNKIGICIEKRKKEHIRILQVWSSNANYPQPDFLDNLWIQMQKLKEVNWLETHILRTYVYFNKYLNEAIEHEIPSIDRDLIRKSKNLPLPRCVFRLFQPSDCIDNDIALPVGDSIERFLVEEDLNWIIDNNYTDWKLCARSLLNYYRKETVPLNYVVIEVIFSQLFRLPNPPHLELFYGALLIELCRTQSSSMPQVLALAAEMLYQRTDRMQPICLDRFVDWFSYHLSNFEYHWSWSDWAECVELDSLHPKRIFVREVIDKCMRLSYYKKLLEILPKEFGPIIPDEPNINYILDDERSLAFDKAEQLKEIIMQKRSDEDILSVLAMIKKEDEPINAETAVYSPDSVAIFFAVLLKLASKTLTHSFAALTRYHKSLSALTNGNEAMQSIILRTLYDSWSLHKQMMTILVDKMIKMKILEPTIVQAWVFSEEMKVEFKRTWVWDVLSSAVVHLEKQGKKFARDSQFLEKRMRRFEAKSISMERGVGDQMMDQNEEGGGKAPRIMGPSNGEEDEGERIDLDENMEEETINDPVEFDERIQRTIEQIQKNSLELERNEEMLRMIMLSICHKFTLIITEHIFNCETDGTEVETNFYNFVTGRFKYMLLKHRESAWKYAADLERELFSSPTIEPRIRQIFEQFKSLH